MIICICNNFNSEAVEKYLAKAAAEKKTVDKDALYKVCSGGQDPGCYTCYDTVLDDMVKKHNKTVAGNGTPSPP